MIRLAYPIFILFTVLLLSCKPKAERLLDEMKPGLEVPEYGELIREYKKQKIVFTEKIVEQGITREHDYFNFKHYKVYFNNWDKSPDYLRTIELRFIPTGKSKYTANTFNDLITTLKPLYGEPTEMSLNDTSRYGYAYADWRNHDDYVAKLEFLRDTTNSDFYMRIKATVKLVKRLYSDDERNLKFELNNLHFDWNFSNDEVINKYFHKILFSHSADSIKNYAINDFKNGKYYAPEYELWPDSNSFHLRKYAKEKYGLTLINLGDMDHLSTTAYFNTVMPLLREKGIPPMYQIYREARAHK